MGLGQCRGKYELAFPYILYMYVIQYISSFICVLKVINFELYVQAGEVERFKS